MRVFTSLACAAAIALAAGSAWSADKAKNWTAPNDKIYAQTLSDQIMAEHPELLSVTFHGVPPGMSKVYTMFAGSFPERIGNPDDPDDIDVITKGITIVDPRWNKNDTVRKFVMMMPLRDAAGSHLGLLVLAFKRPQGDSRSENDFFVAASKLRDSLQPRIKAYAELFQPTH